MNASGGIYVYAAVPARTEVISAGTLADVRLLVVGDIGFVVGDADMAKLAAAGDMNSDASSLAELAWKHDAVVREVMSLASGVIPFRLGTVLRDDCAVREFAGEHAAELALLLDRLTGSMEWGVQVSARSKPAQPEQHVRPATNRPGTAFLASRRQALDNAERRAYEQASVAAEAADELRELAADAVSGGNNGAVILDESYLVAQANAGRFLDAADRLRTRLARDNLTFRVTGPWPPYSFARLGEMR